MSKNVFSHSKIVTFSYNLGGRCMACKKVTAASQLRTNATVWLPTKVAEKLAFKLLCCDIFRYVTEV